MFPSHLVICSQQFHQIPRVGLKQFIALENKLLFLARSIFVHSTDIHHFKIIVIHMYLTPLSRGSVHCTAPTLNEDLKQISLGPNGDLILSEMGTQWGPSTAEMGTQKT